MACRVPISIRPCRMEDRPFILQTWVRSLADAPTYRWLPAPAFYAEMNARAHHLVERYADTTFMAVLDTDDDAFVGWVCSTPGQVIHHLYVKHACRRMGVATALVMHAAGKLPISATHWGEHCDAIAVNHPMSLFYQPGLVRHPRRNQQGCHSRTYGWRDLPSRGKGAPLTISTPTVEKIAPLSTPTTPSPTSASAPTKD